VVERRCDGRVGRFGLDIFGRRFREDLQAWLFMKRRVQDLTFD
jgi:hypothetical protein